MLHYNILALLPLAPTALGAAILPRQAEPAGTPSSSPAASSITSYRSSIAATTSSRGTITGGTPSTIPSSRSGSYQLTPSSSRASSSISRASSFSAILPTATAGYPPTSEENPCGLPEEVLDDYDYLDAQIALRYGPSPSFEKEDGGADNSTSRSLTSSVASASPTARRPKTLAHTLQCLHPGGPLSNPSSPSIGLVGGLNVRLVPCQDAYYRWSIREDGKGVVVGNGYYPLWALNAEDKQEGANVTIREVDQASGNQSFSLTESGQLRLDLDNDGDDGLCVNAADEKGITLAPCSEDWNNSEQTWAILLQPRPVITRVTSTVTVRTTSTRGTGATGIAQSATAAATITSRIASSYSRVPGFSSRSPYPTSSRSSWSRPIGCPTVRPTPA